MQLERYIDAVLRLRWLVVALAVLILLITVAGGRFITVASDYRILFKKDNPYLLAFDALEETLLIAAVATAATGIRARRY